ncbi:AP-3 complex subunit sigma-1 [Paramecium bursaria]
MIKVFLIVNSQGKVRIRRFYEGIDFEKQSTIEKKLFELTQKLSGKSCNFFKDLDGIYDKKCKIIIQMFGALYFIAIIDEDESELGILDLIQNIVELMDKMFDNAQEIDMLHQPDRMNMLIDEVIVAGIVVEANLSELYDTIKLQETLRKK